MIPIKENMKIFGFYTAITFKDIIRNKVVTVYATGACERQGSLARRFHLLDVAGEKTGGVVDAAHSSTLVM